MAKFLQATSCCRPVRKHSVGSRCGPSISNQAMLPSAQHISSFRALNAYGARQWLLANRASAEKPRGKPWEWKPEQPEAEQGPVLLRTLRRLAAISQGQSRSAFIGSLGGGGRAGGLEILRRFSNFDLAPPMKPDPSEQKQ